MESPLLWGSCIPLQCAGLAGRSLSPRFRRSCAGGFSAGCGSPNVQDILLDIDGRIGHEQYGAKTSH
jgi:hypothetical protein